MKITTLLETMTTPTSDPVGNQSQQAPRFGRNPHVLEDDTLEETTTAGAIATGEPNNMGVQRRGKGSMLQGIKTSKKFANSAAVTEMDKSQTPPGRDGKISHSTYGSRDKGGSTGSERTAKATTADKMMKHAHDVMMKSMSDADKVKKGWRNPNMKEQGMAEGSDNPWGDQGNFAGDTPVNLGGAVVKNLGIGDIVSYLGQKAKILAMSKTGNTSRIHIPSSMGGVTKDVLTKDLKRTSLSEEELDEACWKGYHKEGNKKMFGKTYPNCVKNEGVAEEKQRLDPKCWAGYKKQGTKMKGDTRVNNCVPVEEAEKYPEPEQQVIDATRRARLQREREPQGSEKIDAMLAQRDAQRREYEQAGKFWLKKKDTQEHISDAYVGKAQANQAALQLLKQHPELKGNIVITAWGPGETPMNEAELSEEQLLARDLKKQLELFKQAVDNDLGTKPNDKDLGKKPKDKEVQKK